MNIFHWPTIVECTEKTYNVIVMDQSWYWTEGWQQAELEADEAFAQGAFKTFDTIDKVIEYLNK